MTEEEKIIHGCIKGLRKAQNQLYQKYSAGMYGVCLRYGRDVNEAEDMLQNGFIRIFSNIHTFRNQGSFEGWMRRIMVNTAINHLRKLKRSVESQMVSLDETLSDYLPDEEDKDEGYEYGCSPEKLIEIIHNLPPGYRMVLNLYVFEGYTHKEIGAELNISENTSKTQLVKARKYIRRKIEELNPVQRVDIARR